MQFHCDFFVPVNKYTTISGNLKRHDNLQARAGVEFGSPTGGLVCYFLDLDQVGHNPDHPL